MEKIIIKEPLVDYLIQLNQQIQLKQEQQQREKQLQTETKKNNNKLKTKQKWHKQKLTTKHTNQICRTCKYWEQSTCNKPLDCQFAHFKMGQVIKEKEKQLLSTCNKPLDCQFAHFKMGQVIKEKEKQLENLTQINQQLRNGSVLAKITTYQILTQYELEEVINKKQQHSLAREIAISYENSKAYKHLKQKQLQIMRNKIFSKIEKQKSIQQVTIDELFNLKTNNNEKNAYEKKIANEKRKKRREEKRVQNQLIKETQKLIQSNLSNNNQPNPSEQYVTHQINEEISEENKNQSEVRRLINKYADVIDKQIDNSMLIEQSLNQQQPLPQYKIDNKNNEEWEEDESKPPNSYEDILKDQQQSSQKYDESDLKLTQAAEIYIDHTQQTRNNAHLNPLSFLKAGDQKFNRTQVHNNFMRELSPKNTKQIGKINRLQEYQFYKQLNQNCADIAEIVHLDNQILDSINKNDSITQDQILNMLSSKKLYDWKIIYNSQLYYSSQTQNVFVLNELTKDQELSGQLINLYTDQSNKQNFSIPEYIVAKLDQTRQAEEYKQKNYKTETVIVIDQNIAKQVFENYTTQEIQELFDIYQSQLIKKDDNKENKDLYPFILIFQQILIHILQDLYGSGLKEQKSQYNIIGQENLIKAIKTNEPYFYYIEISGPENHIFFLYHTYNTQSSKSQ